MGQYIHASPAIAADGTVYIGSGNNQGFLHAVNPDGTLKWLYQTSRQLSSSSPVIGANGLVYVGNGVNVLALVDSNGGPALEGWPMYLHDAQHTGRQTLDVTARASIRQWAVADHPGAEVRFADQMAANLWFTAAGDDLVIQHRDRAGEVRLRGWFTAPPAARQVITDRHGARLAPAGVARLVALMSRDAG